MKLTGIGVAGYESLDDILNDSQSNSLFERVKPKESPVTADSVLLSKFREIEVFYEAHQREPNNHGDYAEKTLARSLAALRKNTQFVESLKGHDQYGLLSQQGQQQSLGEQTFSLQATEPENTEEPSVKEIPVFNSLDDILAFEANGVLADLGDVSIYDNFDGANKPNNSVPYPDEMIGTRYECEDFWKFQPYFEKIKVALKDGTATFNQLQTEQNLFVGDIFLLNGLVCFIAEKTVEERKSKRKNYRLRLIFENGLESNMLMRSLAVAIYKDENGRQILLNDENALAQMFNQDIESLPTGYIYITKLSQAKPELSRFKHLHKVGFTRGDVEARLKNCEDDIAFLESKVHVVAKIQCKNLNPHAFEQMIHAFLYAQRLNLTLKSKDGQLYKPKEWFDADSETILEVAQRILDQTIVNYRMDNTTGKLIEK